MSSMADVEGKVLFSKRFMEAVVTESCSGILSAYSGGPDSTALIWFLLKQLSGSVRIGAAYFDHGLRGEKQSTLEYSHVAENAERMGVVLHYGSAQPGEIAAYAKDSKLSVEEAARILRYRFLRSTAESRGYSLIATGHTKDDLTETLIQRFFQGSGIEGLSGIPRIAGVLIRPILNWSREDVDAYNVSQGLVPFEDPSNGQDTYLRNRIRHSLIPAISEVFPGFRRSLVTLAEKMELAGEYLEESVANRVCWQNEGASFTMEVDRFTSLHAVERIETVRALFDRVHKGNFETKRLPFRVFSRLVELPDLHDNALLLRGWGYRLQVHAGILFFEPDVVFRGEKGYFKAVKERGGSRWCDTLSTAGIRIQETTKAGDASLPIHGITFPLVVRSRREGDVIRLGPFSRNLKKLYNAWNVPEQIRWKIPVCEDKTGIIAILGSLFGFPDVIRKYAAQDEVSVFFHLERVEERIKF